MNIEKTENSVSSESRNINESNDKESFIQINDTPIGLIPTPPNDMEAKSNEQNKSCSQIALNATVTKELLCVSSNVETICDDISTAEDIKKLKHVQGRSNSTGKLYQTSRRVSFPENDKELVTGYLEPADPWACGESN